jgi:predicted nucleotidyltransferase component of viral defense system
MNKTNFKKYSSYVKEKKKSNIEEYYVEKDYIISLFLSTWQKLKDNGKVSNLDKLIFKGGTLLIRNFLNYPRISEDIDFTYEKCNNLRMIKSGNKREKEIKKVVVPIIDEIKLICDIAKFDFQTDRTSIRHIDVRNSRAVYILNVYYKSLITGEEIPIKVELNFLEEIIHKPAVSEINNIVDQDLFLKSIGYDLVNMRINTYPLDEIILEKYRAILTREGLKERDVFDLFLINKGQKDVFKTDNNLIFKKIVSSFLISHVSKENLVKNCDLLSKGTFGVSDDDIARLTLTEIDAEKYEEFKNRIFNKLKDICKRI